VLSLSCNRDNLLSNIRQQGDKWIFAAPFSEKTPIPLFDTNQDTGLFVKAILLNREKTLDKNVLGATDYYTPLKIIEEFKKAKPETGGKLSFYQVPEEAYKKALADNGMPDFIQKELYENMMFM
jgi:hypothetical protein